MGERRKQLKARAHKAKVERLLAEAERAAEEEKGDTDESLARLRRAAETFKNVGTAYHARHADKLFQIGERAKDERLKTAAAWAGHYLRRGRRPWQPRERQTVAYFSRGGKTVPIKKGDGDAKGAVVIHRGWANEASYFAGMGGTSRKKPQWTRYLKSAKTFPTKKAARAMALKLSGGVGNIFIADTSELGAAHEEAADSPNRPTHREVVGFRRIRGKTIPIKKGVRTIQLTSSPVIGLAREAAARKQRPAS